MFAPSQNPRKPLPGDPNLRFAEFNDKSKATLKDIDPTLAQLMFAVEAQHPDAFEISEGMRSPDRQTQLVAEGKSQTLNSRHLGGDAVDIHMVGPDGQPNWNFEDYRPIADTAKATAATMGIPDFVWGGDWKTLKDGVHFQVGQPGGVASTATAGVPLSFGAGMPGAMGMAEMFRATGGEGLSMSDLGLAPPKRPGADQMLVAEARRDDEMKRKIALADLMRF